MENRRIDPQRPLPPIAGAPPARLRSPRLAHQSGTLEVNVVNVAHRIAVLDDGQIVELGTHDELMERTGLYAHLYSMQFRHANEVMPALHAALPANGSPAGEKSPQRTTGLWDAIRGRA